MIFPLCVLCVLCASVATSSSPQELPQPGLVIAIGTCSGGMGMFKGGYNIVCPVDKIVPVAMYVPGCPPKPEAMIMGVVKLIQKLKESNL